MNQLVRSDVVMFSKVELEALDKMIADENADYRAILSVPGGCYMNHDWKNYLYQRKKYLYVNQAGD